MWYLGAPPQRSRGAPQAVPLSPLRSLGGRDSVCSGLEGGSACPAFGGLHPQPGAGSAAAGSGRTGCVGTPRETHPDTVGDTHPQGGSILPPPRSHIPPTPSRWNPQCRNAAPPPTRFSGVDFPRHVPLPATTRGTRCGCDPRDVTRVQFPWMSPQLDSRRIHPLCSRFPSFPPAPQPAVRPCPEDAGP